MISLRKNNILERLSGKTQYIMKSIKNFLRCGTLKDFVFVSFFVKNNQGGKGGPGLSLITIVSRFQPMLIVVPWLVHHWGSWGPAGISVHLRYLNGVHKVLASWSDSWRKSPRRHGHVPGAGTWIGAEWGLNVVAVGRHVVGVLRGLLHVMRRRVVVVATGHKTHRRA